MRYLVSPIALVSIILLSPQSQQNAFPLSVYLVLGSRKSCHGPNPVNTINVAWLRFRFWAKLLHKHRYVNWCVMMLPNPELFFPQFYTFLTNCFAHMVHNFKMVLLIDRTTLCQEFMMFHITAIANPLFLTKLNVLFPVLKLLDDSIGMIGLWFQCHSHAPMVRQKLWPFWATFLFAQILVILKPSSLIPYLNILKNYLAFELMISKIIFYTASMFLAIVGVLEWPDLTLSPTSYSVKVNKLYHNWACLLLASQDFKYPGTFNFVFFFFYTKINKISLMNFFEQ